MVLCPNSHDNLSGLSNCRVCGLPLLNLPAEFTSLANAIASRTEMGRVSPPAVLVGLGKVGAGLVDICRATCSDPDSACSYLAIDTNGIASHTESCEVCRLKLGIQTPNAGTFCGIGEDVIRSDPYLMPSLRQTGLSHEDGHQVVFFTAGIGGGIGSAPAVLVEKCRQINPTCHTLVLVVIPGACESFHNHLNAYYGLSRLLGNGVPSAADLVIAVNYDRLKGIKGVGAHGQELTMDSLMAALINLLMKNVSSQYISEIVRINRSIAVKLMVPCLALGRSLEIFGSLSNILESAIVYPANYIYRPAVLTCHLLLRVPESQAASFGEELVNEHLWELVKRYLPGVKATSSSITFSKEQHDRAEACLLLGGDSVTNALFTDSSAQRVFQEEASRQMSWKTYGLNEESVKQAGEIIAEYDFALARVRGERRGKRMKASQEK